jgi:hypothetical protein
MYHALIQRRQVQDKHQALVSKEGQHLRQQAGPDGHDGHVLIGQQQRQRSLSLRVRSHYQPKTVI